ncbi:MAG: sigma-70 family RNA polymerase sigma factor [Planctomycetia bacterium]|nr:sigma-70 family RNA polymerase sigma factor [Planctomycetia bacterium]
MSDSANLHMKASQVFLEYHEFVRKVAFLVAPAEVLNDEIVNDVFVEFVTNAKKWDFSRDLPPLLQSITKKVALRHWHIRLKHLPGNLKRIAVEIQRLSSELGTDESFVNTDEELLALELCMKELTREQRELLTVHYFDGMSIVTMAKAMGQKPNSLYCIFSRLRNMLRSCIEKTLSRRDSHDT